VAIERVDPRPSPLAVRFAAMTQPLTPGPSSGDALGRTRLGNPANSDTPRPPGACRVLMIGDMIGKPGRVAVEQLLPDLRDQRGIDFVTANGENVAGGMGLTPATADTLLAAGVDVITSGMLQHAVQVRPIHEGHESQHSDGP
jgi:hypothetical protein